MILRLKLAWNSTFIVALILSLSFLGTYLMFKQHITTSFYKRLQTSALTAAFFHLEKDELNAQKYEVIEKKYQEIHRESIRFFDKENRMVFEFDTLHYKIDPSILNRIRENKTFHFTKHERQFAGIFYQDNEGDYVVLASDVDKDGIKQLSMLKLYFVIFLVIGLVLSFLLTLLLAKKTFRPFAMLIQNVSTISANNLHERLIINSAEKDELSELTQAFNHFLERLEKGVKSQHNFLKHASHELKTPLASIIGHLEVTLSRPRENTEYREKMQALYTDALHIKSILEGLLVLSGLESSHNTPFSSFRLDELLWDILEKISMNNPDAIMQLNLQDIENKPELLEIYANRDLLMIAIGNLIDNALKFSHNQPIDISLNEHEGRLCIAIADQGIGIEESELNNIFNLFYRSAKNMAIPGHGIGLHLSKQIFDLHRIEMEVHSSVGKGTYINLLFPEISSPPKN
ncbi:HAMP domain-containing sensor histidine kinase [Olivibacter domesticus]|uniref:histidine kinase n=1 Tax=Olivibacter domesticus TaxID=407022 RepID=A0A1H7VFY2_OLID1|nr:HAMP domain-containing sensor histidine kinase [Olivibacter domesticus]SEM08143.1 Signal transduction histidine kinase [Olivibacter domesticus]